MVLYELTCISRAGLERPQTHTLIRNICQAILESSGVLRKIECTGERPLPYRIRNQREYCYEGLYWSVWFNASPRSLAAVRKAAKGEQQLLRSTILKECSSFSHQVLNCNVQSI